MPPRDKLGYGWQMGSTSCASTSQCCWLLRAVMLECADESPEDLVAMQIMIHLIWNGVWDSAFFTSSRAMLILLISEPHFERQEVGVLTWEGFWRPIWTWQEWVVWFIGDACMAFGPCMYLPFWLRSSPAPPVLYRWEKPRFRERKWLP